MIDRCVSCGSPVPEGRHVCINCEAGPSGKNKNILLLIDSKMNSVEVEVNQHMLKLLGFKKEDVKNHKSRRQLLLEVSEYLKSFEK